MTSNNDRNIFTAYGSNRSSFNFQKKLSFYVLADVVEKLVSVTGFFKHLHKYLPFYDIFAYICSLK